MTEIRFHYQAAWNALLGAKRVLVIAHKKPDGDTLGASSAVYNFCKRRGIAADVFCVDEIPDQYLYMPGADDFTADPAVFGGQHDVVAVFDAGDLRFAGVADFMAGKSGKPTILNFDHHVTNERYGHINVLDANASSTAEVVYNFFRSCGAEIDHDAATCLITGILTDTGSFTNPATTASSLNAASDLLRRGAKIHEVSRRLVRNKTVAALQLWGVILSRLKHHDGLGIASTVIFKEDLDGGAIDDEHVEGVANFLGTFLEAKVILVLRDIGDNKIKGSFRTTEDIDVSAVAKALGGGGHKKAAGFTIEGKIVETPRAWQVVGV